MQKQLILLFMLLSFFGKSQEETKTLDSLLIVKGGLGENIFVVGDSVVNKRYFNDIIKAHDEANEFFRKGSNLNILSTIIGVAGGGAIGFSLGRWLFSDNDPIWAIGGAGAIALMINIPIVRSSNYNLKKSVDVYNSGLNNNLSLLERGEVHFLISPNRVGLQFNF